MAGKPIYEFGPFCLEPDEHRLFKEGQALGLSPQLFDLLVLLVEDAGHLLTKKELRCKLWGERHLIDPDALKVRIGHLREQLGDDQKRPRYIETVRGKGYRFIAPVRRVESEPTGAAAEGEPAPPESPPNATLQVEGPPAAPIPQTQRRSVRRVWLVSACVLLLFIISVLAWPFVFPPRPPKIIAYHALTHEGHQIGGPFYTDGFRIYFTEKIGDRYSIGAVPVNGDSDPVYLSTPSKNPWMAGMFPGGESLLVGDSWPPEAFWKVRLPAGSPQPMGKVHGIAVRMAPDGQRYVYEGPRSLFVADLQTGESRRIYSSEHSLVLGANWSPDSTMLCFSRVDPQADKGADAVSLWAVNADGSNLRELVLPQMVPGAGSCSWTPGEKYLLFSGGFQGKNDLWAIPDRARLPLSQAKPVQLTNNPMGFDVPVASPDGTKIFAVSSLQRGELVHYDQKVGAWLPFLKGISAGAVDTSRDGKWIAYVRHPEATLWRSRVDGSDARQLTFPPYVVDGPHWSPDGKQIAYRAGLPQKPKYIFIVPAGGGPSRELFPGDSGRPEEGIPTWSADGKSIVFGGLHYSPNTIAIHIVELATGKMSVVPGSGGLWTPRWSPNGRFLVALIPTSDSSVSTGLMLFDFSTRQWKTLLHDAINDPAWSRDGKFIYFNTNDPERAVKRVRVSDGRIEKIVDLKNFTPEWGSFGVYFGLAPDDSPMMLRKVHETEIYAMDVKW